MPSVGISSVQLPWRLLNDFGADAELRNLHCSALSAETPE
jgi:hypothetical protein